MNSRPPGASSAWASSSWNRYTFTPLASSFITKASCSSRARWAHMTSSKSRSSTFCGVSRVSSSPGLCTITWCNRPTSESTWNDMGPAPLRSVLRTPRGDRRWLGHRGPVLQVDRDAGQEGDAGEDERQVLPPDGPPAGVARGGDGQGRGEEADGGGARA